MVSENIIKAKFIIDNLKEHTELAFKLQLDAYEGKLKLKSGDTQRSLRTPSYTIAASGSMFQVVASVTTQLRLQDLGVRKLYTMPLFAALKRSYTSMRYGFTDEIRESIGTELEKTID